MPILGAICLTLCDQNSNRGGRVGLGWYHGGIRVGHGDSEWVGGWPLKLEIGNALYALKKYSTIWGVYKTSPQKYHLPRTGVQKYHLAQTGFTCYNDTMPVKGTRTSAINRFVIKVYVPQDPAQCWIWTGARYHYGHGAFAPDGSVARSTPAHRWLYQYVHGVTLPSDITVNHNCDVPPCVNPAHLYAGTHKDNMRDMVARGRQSRGAMHPSARLTEADVVSIRASTESLKKLAQKYPVNSSCIGHIRQGLTWRHIKV